MYWLGRAVVCWFSRSFLFYGMVYVGYVDVLGWLVRVLWFWVGVFVVVASAALVSVMVIVVGYIVARRSRCWWG